MISLFVNNRIGKLHPLGWSNKNQMRIKFLCAVVMCILCMNDFSAYCVWYCFDSV